MEGSTKTERRNYRYLTNEDKLYIRQNYDKKRHKDIASDIGCKVQAVNGYLFRCGLTSHSIDKYKDIVRLVKEGYSRADIAKMYNLKPYTISTILHKMQKRGYDVVLPRRGRNRKTYDREERTVTIIVEMLRDGTIDKYTPYEDIMTHVKKKLKVC